MRRALKIAVADDEPDTLEYLQELLSRLGHQVVAARDGRQLLELCRASASDLVVTDYAMPGLDGLAVAAEVTRERPVPVVLISGRPPADLLAIAGGDCVVACLVKPVKEADLRRAIDLAVASSEQSPAVGEGGRQPG